jgi:agmatinase
MTMTTELKPIPVGRPTFLDARRCEELGSLRADVAVIGVPYSSPYDMQGSVSLCGGAPDAIRQQSMRLVPTLAHYNFDFDDRILGDRIVDIVDCGDVAMSPGRFDENRRAASAAIKAILDRGAVPFVLGGDHGVSIPAMLAYENRRSMCVVQIDAHLDWRKEVNGVRFGQSSPMRRASEMAWVDSMIQIGLRAAGSARQTEVDAAREYGSILVKAAELHKVGVEEVLRKVPPADRYYVTVDIDGFDPSIAPGTGFPPFGGLTYYEATDLLRGIATKGKVVGFDLVEVAPGLDIANSTSFLAAQLILNMIGALAHAGQIGSKD